MSLVASRSSVMRIFVAIGNAPSSRSKKKQASLPLYNNSQVSRSTDLGVLSGCDLSGFGGLKRVCRRCRGLVLEHTLEAARKERNNAKILAMGGRPAIRSGGGP